MSSPSLASRMAQRRHGAARQTAAPSAKESGELPKEQVAHPMFVIPVATAIEMDTIPKYEDSKDALVACKHNDSTLTRISLPDEAACC